MGSTFYRRKDAVVEAVSFEQFVKIGKEKSPHRQYKPGELPWFSDYKGNPVTHENDELYLITTKDGIIQFGIQDKLTSDGHGNLTVWKPELFARYFEPA